MGFNIFEKVGDDSFDNDSGSKGMDLHPEGVYYLQIKSAELRTYNSGNLCCECEFDVLAKDGVKPDRETGSIMREPDSSARIWYRHFLFTLVNKQDPEMGFKQNVIGSRIFIQMLQALSGYGSKEEIEEAYDCDIEEELNDDGNIINAADITGFYADNVNMMCSEQLIKSEVSIRESGEFKSNELKWFKELSKFEERALELFQKGETVQDTSSEKSEEATKTDDDIPF